MDVGHIAVQENNAYGAGAEENRNTESPEHDYDSIGEELHADTEPVADPMTDTANALT